MANESNFWWLTAPHSDSVAEICDMNYSITKDNFRKYIDSVFFPYSYPDTPYLINEKPKEK